MSLFHSLTRSRLAIRSQVLVAGAFAFASATALPVNATVVDATAWYDVIGRDLKISNARFTGVGDGNFSSNTAIVRPGSSLNLSFDWSLGGNTSNYSYCPFCIIQSYVAWVQPSQAQDSSSGFFSGIVSSDSSARSGSYSWSTTAPSEGGTYYIGSAFSLEFDYLNNVPGRFGAPDSVGPYGTVAPFKVRVDVPGPLPALGLASAVYYRRKLRRRISLRS